MSGSGTCSYFILKKSKYKKSDNDDENEIITIDNTNSNQSKNLYILPYNNIEYYKNNGLFEKGLIEWSKQFCSIDKNILDIISDEKNLVGNIGMYLSFVSKDEVIVFALSEGKAGVDIQFFSLKIIGFGIGL